jgi:hypothetical protein
MAVGVSSSLLAPHAVTTGTTMPFWRRAGSSRFSLRTSELRRAFLERGAWEEEVEEFRLRRIGLQRSAPAGHPFSVLLVDEPAFLLHVLPLGRLRDWIDIIPHWDLLKQRLTFGQRLYDGRTNFDGILRTHRSERNLTRYVQWFHFGGVEAYTAVGARSRFGPEHGPVVDAMSASVMAVEYPLVAMQLLDGTFGVSPPYAVLLSILNARERALEVMRELQSDFDPHHLITEQDLLFPLVLFDHAHEDVQPVAAGMRPILDAFWQAGGLGRCRAYKDDKWIGRTFTGWETLM